MKKLPVSQQIINSPVYRDAYNDLVEEYVEHMMENFSLKDLLMMASDMIRENISGTDEDEVISTIRENAEYLLVDTFWETE
jgi:hypothetical protein